MSIISSLDECGERYFLDKITNLEPTFDILLNILVLAFVEFSLAGVHLRYMMDLLPMSTFISLLTRIILGMADCMWVNLYYNY